MAFGHLPEPRRFARIPLSMLTILLVTQGLFLSHALRLDDYHDGYLPAVSYLKEHGLPRDSDQRKPGLLFALPDYRLISDSRLHDSAEYVVVDRWYLLRLGFVYRNYEPQTAVEVQRKLEMYEPVWERGGWTILHRRRAGNIAQSHVEDCSDQGQSGKSMQGSNSRHETRVGLPKAR